MRRSTLSRIDVAFRIWHGRANQPGRGGLEALRSSISSKRDVTSLRRSSTNRRWPSWGMTYLLKQRSISRP